MARSDLLLALVKAGRAVSDPRFRHAVEALVAEERAQKHSILADQLVAALHNGSNGPPVQVASTPFATGDLFYEMSPERAIDSLVLPQVVARECRDLVEEHRRADLLRSFNLAPRHRVLLVGPPGNGKTSLAEALARELMVPLLRIRYEGLIGSYLGETASRLRKVFDHARQRPCVLFFDEFETLGKERGDEHETGEIKRVVSTLLLQIDSLPSYVVVVTATNHGELLDRAVWRRFQLRLCLPRPTQRQLGIFVKQSLAKLEFARKVSPDAIVTGLRRASFSEAEDFVQDTARRYLLAMPGADIQRIVRERLNAWQARVTPDRE